jgi:hypothetical protein
VIIVYRPDEGEERRWDLSQTRIMAVEAEQVERITDLTWNQARERLADGSMRALRAIAFVLLKRDQPTLRYGEFNPPASALDWEFDTGELVRLRETIVASDEPEESKAEALADVDALLAERVADDAAEAADLVPKASAPGPSPTSG